MFMNDRSRTALAAALLSLGLFALTDLPNAAAQPAAGAAATAAAGGALETARGAWQQGDFDRTLVALKTALREDAFNQDALLLLADLQLARMDGAAAETTLRRALDAQAPRAQVPRAQVVLPLARALLLQGKPRAVLDELQPSGDLDAATRARLLAQHAAAQIALGEQARAAALLDEAAAAAPQAAEPDMLRAVLLLQGGAADAALAALERALGKAPDAYEARLLKGDIERMQGDVSAAEATYGEAIARSPNRWLAAFSRAVARLDQGNLDGAEADIALAEAQFPNFLGLAYAKARLDLARGRATDAANGFELYLGGAPADTNALFYAAYTANVLGNREQAYDYLERLQRTEGATPRLLLLKASTLLVDEDPVGAWALLKDVVSVDAPLPRLVVPAQSALLRLGRADEALDLVVRARAVSPESADLLAAEARLRLAAGESDAVEALAADLAKRAPDSVEPLILRAQLAAQREQVSDILLAEVRAAREQAPQDSRLPLLLAVLHGARGEIEPACGLLVEVLRQDPTADNVIARLRGFGCAERTPDLLQDAYQDLLASHPDAVRALPALLAMGAGAADADGGLSQLQDAVQAAPRNAKLRAALVVALLQAKHTADAASALEGTPPEQLGDPDILRATGLLALVREDPEAAVRAFQGLLSAAPGTAAPAYLLAEAQAQAGDLSGARYHLTEGLRLDPGHVLSSIAATRIFVADTSPKARRQLIDDIKRQAPDSPLVPSLQAQNLIDAGRPDKAAELLRQMHDARPDNPRLLARLLTTLNAAERRADAKALGERWATGHASDAGVALVLGDLSALDGDMDRAAHWYRQALDQVPDNASALNNLAYIVTATDPRGAVRLAERALRQDPNNPDVLDTLGMALLAAGDATRARERLNQAYSYSNQRPVIGLHLAQAMAADGDPMRARALLRPLLQQEFAEQAQARALMQELGTKGQ